jgi:hypothetical protein
MVNKERGRWSVCETKTKVKGQGEKGGYLCAQITGKTGTDNEDMGFAARSVEDRWVRAKDLERHAGCVSEG